MTADAYLLTRDPLLVADGVGIDADTLCHEIRMAFLAGEAEGLRQATERLKNYERTDQTQTDA